MRRKISKKILMLVLASMLLTNVSNVFAHENNVEDEIREVIEETPKDEVSEDITDVIEETQEEEITDVVEERQEEEITEDDKTKEPELDAVRSNLVTLFEISTGITEDLFTGQTASLKVDIIVSDQSDPISNPKIIIEMDADYVAKVNASDLASQTGKLIYVKDGKQYIEYSFNNFSAGQALSIPMTVTSREFLMPDGSKIKPVAKLVSEDGTVLFESNTLELGYKTRSYRIAGTAMRNGQPWANPSSNGSKTIYSGLQDPAKPGYLSPDISKTTEVAIHYGMEIEKLTGVDSSLGNRKFTHYDISIKLPAGATFVTTAGVNDGWTYNSSTRTATRRVSFADVTGYKYDYMTSSISTNLINFQGQPGLVVSFPGAKINEPHTFDIDTQYYPAETDISGKVYKASGVVDVIPTSTPEGALFRKTRTGDEAIPDSIEAKSLEYGFKLTLFNDKSIGDITYFNMRDNSLQEPFRFTRVEFVAGDYTGSYSLYATDATTNVETLVRTGIKPTGSTIISVAVPNNTNKLRVESETGGRLPDGKDVSVYPYVKFHDPVGTTAGPTGALNIFNSARVDVGYEGHEVAQSNSGAQAYYILVKYDPALHASGKIKSAKPDYLVGDTINYVTAVGTNGKNAILTPDTVKGKKIVSVLPFGLEYIDNSALLQINYQVTMNPDLSKLKPTIDYNYRNTGRTAVIFEIGELDNLPVTSGTGIADFFTIEYKAKVTNQMDEGQNYFDDFFAYDNTNKVPIAEDNDVVDIFDVNANGSKADAILGTKTPMNYVAPRETLITSYSKGSMDGDYKRTPAYAKTTMGGPGVFKLNIKNLQIQPITRATLIDILPFVGDYSTSFDGSGKRTPRNSELTAKLTGPVVLPAGYKAYYNTELPTGSPQEYAASTAWKSSVTDYSTVVAVKIVMDAGVTIAPESIVEFELPIKTDANAIPNSRANNSFGLSTDGGNIFYESNIAQIRPSKLVVQGTIFLDKDKNNLISDNDQLLSGKIVTLLDEAGNPVKDASGKVITGTTNSNGYYEIDLPKDGKYKVQLEQKDGYLMINKGPQEKSSHLDNTGLSDVFEVELDTTPSATINGGLIIDAVTLKVNNKVLNANGGDLNNGESFDYTITVDGAPYVGKYKVGNQTFETTDGKITLKSFESFEIIELPRGAVAKVTQSAKTDYETTPTSLVISESLVQNNTEMTFINKIKVNDIQVTGNLEWEGGPDLKPTVELQLYRDGVAYGDPVSVPNGTLTNTWTNLPDRDENGKLYVYSMDEPNVPENYEKENPDSLTVKNIYVSPKIEVTGEIVWVGGPTPRPDTEVQLYRDGEPYGDPVIIVDGELEHTWTDLDETDENGVPYVYTMDEVTPENYEKENTTDLKVTNTYVSPKIEVTGEIVWVGGPTPRPDTEVQLYRDGEPYGDPVILVDGELEHTWTDLDETDENGKPYVYTMDEVTPKNYEKENTTDLKVTNTYVSPLIDVTGEIVWVGGPEPRPDTEIQLYRDGEPYGDPVILVDGELEHTWTDLDETDENGNPYVYTMDEVTPENYEKENTTDLKVTNTYVSPLIDVTGEIVWVGGPEPRPDVEIQLYRDGEAYGDPIILKDGELEHTWTDLDETDENGVPYVYTMDEITPENYEKENTTDLKVTNTYVSPLIDITGEIVWVGGPTPRPDTEIQLYRDGEAYGDPIILKDGELEHTWTDLDETDENGVPYVYTMDEITPENYEKENTTDLKVTNTYVSPLIDITGEIVWVGGPTPRPDTEIQLYRDGEAYGDPIILKDGELVYTWTDLDETDENGVPYVYTMDEVTPENYTKENTTDLKVTNTYVSPLIDITGEIVWVGGPKERPSTEIQLYRDGKPYGTPVILKDGQLTYTWKDLDEFDENGVAYVYTLDEVTPNGYNKENTTDLKVTNTYIPTEIPSDNPSTGIANNVWLYSLISLVSIMSLIVLMFTRKKQNNNI